MRMNSRRNQVVNKHLLDQLLAPIVSDCVPDNDSSTQTEAIAGPSGQVPEPNQSAGSATAVVMTGYSTPAEETTEESHPVRRLRKPVSVAFKLQAQRMLAQSSKTLLAVTEDDTVAVSVSAFD